MRKSIVVFLFTVMCGSTSLIAQSSAEAHASVTFCSAKNSTSISYADLLKCDELVTSQNNHKIISFKVSWVYSDASGDKAKEMSRDILVKGNKLSKEAIDAFQTFESRKVKKVYFEDIRIMDGKEEKKAEPILILLK